MWWGDWIRREDLYAMSHSKRPAMVSQRFRNHFAHCQTRFSKQGVVYRGVLWLGTGLVARGGVSGRGILFWSAPIRDAGHSQKEDCGPTAGIRSGISAPSVNR